MPKETTTEAPAADAALASSAPDGVTPPNAASTADNMSLEEAKSVLKTLRTPSRESNPLLDEDDGRDPLANVESSIEDILGLGPETEPEAEEHATDEPEAEPQPEAEPAELTDEPEETPEPLEETTGEKRKRLNINRKTKAGEPVYDARERAILALSAEEGISLAEAERSLFGDRPAATREQVAEAAPVADPVKSLAEIDAELATLKTKRTAAKAEFDSDGATEISEQIADLTIARQDAVLREVERRQSQHQEQGAFSQQVSESHARAIAMYEDAGKEGTKLNSELQLQADRLIAQNSPLLQDSDWPETLAVKIANRLRIAPVIDKPAATAPKPALAKPAQPVAPARRTTPIPAPGSVSAPVPRIDPRAELAKQIETERDPGKLKGLMRQAIALESQRAA